VTLGSRVVSVDLGWKESTRHRTAVAVLSGEGTIRVARLSLSGGAEPFVDQFARHLVGLVAPGGLLLLDIPVDGCEGLSRERPHRGFDRRLIRAGIPLLPPYKAAGYGSRLGQAVRSLNPAVTVQETYPYAILRVLWALRRAERLGALRALEPLTLEEAQWREWPPRYKRARRRDERRKALREIHGLLTHPDLALHFEPPLPAPDADPLDGVADCYDACLGLIPGFLGSDHPWVFRAGDAGGGSMLILADRALRARLAGCYNPTP
jgi:predicted nuclease with RNAse H fold